MPGDYVWFKHTNHDLTADVPITALIGTGVPVVLCKNGNYQVYLQRASLVVTTYLAAVVTIVGSVTGRVYAEFNVPATAPTTAGETNYQVDYGPSGLACVLGESLLLNISQAGLVADLHIEAYQKIGQTVAGSGTYGVVGIVGQA